MKNLRYKRNALYLLICLMLVSSCQKSFLELDPIGTTNEKILATKSGLNKLLIGAYAALPLFDTWFGISNSLFGSMASDDAYVGSFGDIPDQEIIERYTYDGTNPSISGKWKVIYGGVQRSNDVLRTLALAEPGSLTAEEEKQIKAEAIFLRAVYHLEAAKMWRNAPYIIEEKFTFENNNFPESFLDNSKPMWPELEKDFKFAADNLRATHPEVGRANSWAAKAFLAKVYMFQHKYAEAKTVLEDIIANGVTPSNIKYDLVNFADNFNPVKQNNAETIFSVQSSVNDGAEGYNGNMGDIFSMPLIGLASSGGATRPSFSLVNSYKTDEVTGLPLISSFNDFDVKSDMNILASEPFTPYQGTLDPRLDWTVGRRGIPVFDHGLGTRAWVYNQPVGGPYFNKKCFYWDKDKETVTSAVMGWAQATANNYNMIRFADVLLWAAEVEVEIGSLSKAEGYVNRVRQRAADPNGWVKTYINNNDPSLGFTNTPAANYKIGLYSGQFTAKGKDFAREAVRFERKIELAMEGHRFFDLQRYDNGTGYMANAINTYLAHDTNIPGFGNPSEKGAVFTKGKNEVYPIPQREIDLSVKNGVALLKQNPGYE